jgi:hypothetical protein
MTVRVRIHDNTVPTTVNDANQLLAVLTAASEEARTKNMLAAVMIEAGNGNFITMVVGGEETVLGFDYGRPNAPYYASKGVSDDDDPIMTCYLTFQHHTEFPRKFVIRYVDGLKAVTQFLDSGELPMCITREQV